MVLCVFCCDASPKMADCPSWGRGCGGRLRNRRSCILQFLNRHRKSKPTKFKPVRTTQTIISSRLRTPAQQQMIMSSNMKGENGDYNYMSEVEKTGVDKFFADLKESTFAVLFVLLKEEDEGVLMFCFQTTLDYIQMLEFIFNEKINAIWKADGMLERIFDIFGFFEVGQQLGNTISWNMYLVAFYSCIFAIVLTVLDIIYVSYSFNRKRFSMLWPLIVLRSVVTYSVTVLFLPITEFLISMVECQDDGEGLYVHESYPEIECWKGSHIFHGVVAMTNILIFVMISLVVALNYFESRITSNDPTARSNSRADVVFIINKIMLQTAFAFVPAGWDWPLVIMIFVGGLVLWYLYQFDDPYYNEIISKLFKILSAYYMWTCFMLFVAKILESTSFEGGLVSWVVGLPFIIVIMLSETKGNVKMLTKNQIKFETPNELMDHLRFVLQLIEKQKTNKNSYLLLAGYIEKHKEACDQEDCPLKTTNKKRLRGRSEMSFEDSLFKLVQVINKMYINGLKKFKRSAKLRIVYAFFLLERLNNKKKALEELSIAEELNPLFDEQFLIYRYKKMIEDQLDDSGNNDARPQGDLDVVGVIAYDNHKKFCLEFIKEASHRHKDFWLELLNDIPNMEKLSFIGSKINLAVKNAQDNWKQLSKINPNVPSILKLYGKFSIHVLNERYQGKLLIERSKRVALLNIENNKGDVDDLDKLNEPFPMAVVGASQESIGYFKKINSQFTALFGYSPEDIASKDINCIMPALYAEHHNTFITNYIFAEDAKSEYLDVDRPAFGKAVNGYIMPLTTKVRLFPTEDEETIFVGTFKTEQMIKNYVYLIADKEGNILDMSSNVQTFFDFDINTLKKGKLINIQLFGKTIMVAAGFTTGKEVFYQGSKGGFTFTCVRTRIVFPETRGEDDSKQVGFQVRLEPKSARDESTASVKSRSGEPETGDSSGPNLQEKLTHLEEDLEDRDMFEFMNDMFIKEGAQQAPRSETGSQRTHLNGESEHQINYGEGVESKRLLGDHLYDIELLEMEDEDEEALYDPANTIFKQQFNNYGQQLEDESSSQKRHDVIKEAINSVKELRAITYFKVCSLFYILAIIGLSAGQLSFTNSFFSSTSELIELLLESNNQRTLLTEVASQVHDLEFLDRGVYTSTNFRSYQEVLIQMDSTADELLANTNKLQAKDFLQKIDRTSDTFVFMEHFSKSVPGQAVSDEMKTEFFSQVQFLISVQVNLTKNFLNSEPQKISLDDIDRLQLNLFSGLYGICREYGEKLYEVLHEDIMDVLQTQLYIIILLVLEALSTVVFTLYFLWLKRNIDRKKETILFLFLDIPRKEVNEIYRKCENFLNFCTNFTDERQNDNRLFLDSSEEEDSFDKQMNEYIKFDDDSDDGQISDFEAHINKKKILRMYRQKHQGGGLSLNLVLIGLLSLVFGVSNMAGVYYQQQQIGYYLVQINSNTLMESHFLDCLNIHRQAMLDPSKNQDGFSIKEKADLCIRELFDNESELFNFHNYISQFSSTFTDLFEKAYFSDACAVLPANFTNCTTIIEGNMANGLTYVQNYIFSWMDRYNAFLGQAQGVRSALQILQEDKTALQAMIQIDDVLKKHIRETIKVLISQEIEEMSTSQDTTNRVLLIILAIYVVVLAVFFVLWIYPTANRLNTEIKITIKMLNMIPINVIMTIHSIRNYLMKLSKDN